MKLPNKKYNIIYADPPWKYKENWGNGSNEHTYPVMSTQSICDLSVEKIATNQSHLYLWVTNPFLKEGLDVCKAWGFNYKTLITWVKTYKDGTPEMGMGYYFHNKTTKNMFMAVNPKLHSKKPDCFRDMIIRCSGDLPRIELFARHNTNGWDAWGNEIS